MTKRLRVCVLSRSYPNAVMPELGLWVERPTVRLAEQCDVEVVSPVPWCPPLPDAGALGRYARFRRVPVVERRNGIDVAHPRLVVGPGSSLYRFEARAYAAGVRRTIERLHREAPFDLLHAHFIYPDGVAAQQFARRLGIPFVVSEHAPWWSVWLDRPGVAAAAVPAANDAAAMLAVSPSVADTIRSYAGDGPRIEIIPVGVDGDFFKPGLNGGRKSDQILFAGILKYVKGVDVLLQAVARLAAKGVAARLLVAGGSLYPDTAWEEREIRELATTLRLDDRVTFLGRLRPEEIARLMAESSVVVLPSKIESFGAVLVEALACGTPVVATRCGGPESIVTDAVGELVPVGDADALAGALDRVLARPERFDRAVLRSYALSRFGLDSVVDRTVELYREVAA